MRKAAKTAAVVSLILLIASGAYDIAVGVQTSGWYLRWYREHYGAMAAASVIFTYTLGLFRGTVALGCGIAGLVQAVKGRVRMWYLILLGWCSSWYVRALFHHAYKGISSKKWVQMLIAVGCFAAIAAYQCVNRRRPARSGDA